MHHRLSENDMAARPRLSLEDGSSSFAALFGGNVQQRNFSSSLARRDSGSSLVSSRLDDLGLNLDLPGLQVSRSCCRDAHHTSSSCVMVMYASGEDPRWGVPSQWLFSLLTSKR